MTYLGPSTLLAPDRAFALGAGWAYQPKRDGIYAEARTDASGRIASVVSRTGRAIPEGAELHGILAGPPGSVLVGELEAHTEAGVAAYARHGYRRLHLFDCPTLAGDDLRSRPYVERWGALHRAQSILEADGLARVETWRDDRTGAPETVGRPRCPVTGRRVRRIPTDLRRLPIIPLLRSLADARDLWREVETGTLEGLVAVRLDAKAGARSAKLKIKILDAMDAAVLATDGRVLHLLAPSGVEFLLASRFAATVRPGQVVEVAHHGWYATRSAPRFGRVRELRDGAEVVRVRFDKAPPADADAARWPRRLSLARPQPTAPQRCGPADDPWYPLGASRCKAVGAIGV